jgi:uncharacterized RDD family membrane protein YckC
MNTLSTAPLGRRVIARVVDVTLAGIIGGVLAVVWIDWAVDSSDSDWGVLGLLVVSAAIVVAIAVLYEVVFVAWGGRTPGKRLTRIRVVRADTGDRVGPIRAAVRLIPLTTIVIPVLGYLTAAVAYGWMVFDEQGRGWHDRLAGTRVVQSEA